MSEFDGSEGMARRRSLAGDVSRFHGDGLTVPAPIGAALRALDDTTRAATVIVLATDLTDRQARIELRHAIYPVLVEQAKHPPPFDLDDTEVLLALADGVRHWVGLPVVRLAVAALEQRSASERALRTARIRGLYDEVTSVQEAEFRKLVPRLRKLLPAADGLAMLAVADGDGWSDAVRASLPVAFGEDAFVDRVLDHLGSATSGTKPTKRWGAELDGFAAEGDAVGVPRHLLVGLLDAPPREIRASWYGNFEAEGGRYFLLLSAANADIVRGAVWAMARLRPAGTEQVLGDVALRCAKSSGHNGWVDGEKVPNACITMLGELGTKAAIGQLAVLRASVTHQGLLKQIARAMGSAAAATGATPTELVEGTVPTFGLGWDGTRSVEVGGTAGSAEGGSAEGGSADGGELVLAIGAKGKAAVRWRAESGAALTGVPAGVAASCADAVAELKAQARELDKTLKAERARTEELLREDRWWSAPTWWSLYVAHPVTGWFGRQLLWRVDAGGSSAVVLPVSDSPDGDSPDGDSQDGGSPDGGSPAMRVVGTDGTERVLGPDDRVAPWHPIRAGSPDEIRAARARLTERGIVQPTKQAWREIYVVTPAEEETAVYSNRFASHILEYPKLYSLLKERRWATNYLGPFDGGDAASGRRTFEAEGIVAWFYFDAVVEDERAFTVAFCSTDQVRFTGTGRDAEPIDLAEVPSAVFSEAMRDVDLFVSVCTIGNDPNWADRGIDRWNHYWEDWAFGEISVSARARTEALVTILPKLKIADRCEIDGRWLAVQGTRGRYKVHLGSGHVQTDDGRYVCIVPERGAKAPGKVYLPFEDDTMLSVVLSKAFLLAADDKITDPTILRQLA